MKQPFETELATAATANASETTKLGGAAFGQGLPALAGVATNGRLHRGKAAMTRVRSQAARLRVGPCPEGGERIMRGKCWPPRGRMRCPARKVSSAIACLLWIALRI